MRDAEAGHQGGGVQAIGEAEVARRLAHARQDLAEWEAGRTTVLGPAYERRELAGSAQVVAFWLYVLGRPDEAQVASQRAEAGYLAWLELQGGRIESSDWLGLFRVSVLADWTDLERRLVELGTDPADGRLVRSRRPWVRALHAIGSGDDTGAREAVAALRVADELAMKEKWYPALGDAVAALLERDAGAFSAALAAVCDRHVGLLKHGALTADPDVGWREPALLLVLARRRGIEPSVADEYRSARLKRKVLYLEEWEGRPLGREQVEIEADITDPRAPWTFVERSAAAAARPAGPRSKLRSEVPEPIVREWLPRRWAIGPPWSVASAMLILGDAASGRRHLADAMTAAERRWRTERVDGRINVNWVMDHFSLALAVGGDEDLRRAIDGLRACERESPNQLSGPTRYAGSIGYLLFLVDLLSAPDGGAHLREAALGMLPPTRALAASLVARDQRAFDEALSALLAEHVVSIDRKYPAAEPVSVAGLHAIIVAARLGLTFSVDPAYRRFPVPFLVTGVPGYDRKVGHLPCDLLGEGLWEPRQRLGVVR